MRIIGAGPAGATAAISACREGAEVRLFEKTSFPRHKVCGEFLSPEVALVFERLGLQSSFLHLQPFAVRNAEVTIGRAVKRWKLDEPAYGISRFALDRFLFHQAGKSGAEVFRETAKAGGEGPVIVATGRQDQAPAGQRQFGFKAHYSGVTDDRIQLFFDRDMYVGINCVEGGSTNVCGLCSEQLLKRHNFQPDALLASLLAARPALKERLQPLTRKMEWLITGPLVYGGKFDARTPPDVYLAGDALGFVDPFTGSGMLGAITTGMLAGRFCAEGKPSSEYLAACRDVLGGQYRASALFRKLIDWGLADKLAWTLSGRRMFELTRPAVSKAI